MRPDWTVPFDDLLTMRFHMCMFCAQPAHRLELRSAEDGFAMTVASCGRCLKADVGAVRRYRLVKQHAQRAQAG
jgi:hypothetical protein